MLNSPLGVVTAPAFIVEIPIDIACAGAPGFLQRAGVDEKADIVTVVKAQGVIGNGFPQSGIVNGRRAACRCNNWLN